MRTLSGSSAISIRRRRPARLNATIRLAQLGRAGDVAVLRVERHADLKPLVTHWVSSRIVPRTEAVDRMPVALVPDGPDTD